MKKTGKRKAVITSTAVLSEGIYEMWIKDSGMASAAKAGQFVSLYCRDESRLLPRPISICEVDRVNGLLRFVYRIAGKGTKEFSKYLPGEMIEVLGPLGNGFPLEGRKAIIVGGGIGIPPMLQLVKELNCEKEIVLGYRDKLFLDEEFKPYGRVFVSTEDGSTGTKGNVIDAIAYHQLHADVIFACGPMPMLKGIQAYAEEHGIQAWISLEERMACGIGACLGCVCKTKHIDTHTYVDNTRICKDGPVFDSKEVMLG